jgi:hypothetical protein
VCDYFKDNEGINSVDEYAELIIQVARKFEAYSCGDLDMQAAEEMVKGE